MFWHGLGIGFLLCAPLGPIGILCMQRTLFEGRLAGALAVVGAAAVDAAYALAAGLVLALLNALLLEGRSVIHPAAGAILAAVGIRVFRGSAGVAGGGKPRRAGRPRRWRGPFCASAALMLSNPLPIVVLSAAFSALQPQQASHGAVAGWVAGVFVGSAFWAPLLVAGVGVLSPLFARLPRSLLPRLCGAALFACGLVLAGTPWLFPSR